MSQVVRISESTYKQLEALAVGFDTPNNVIDRLIDFYAKHKEGGVPIKSVDKPEITDPGSVILLDPDKPADLTHTKIIRAQFGRENVRSWIDLVATAHKYAMGCFNDFDALKDATYSNIMKGSFTDNGFHHYPEIGISIQGANANQSWLNALHLAKQINAEKIEVLLEWRSNKKSAHPGKKGKLTWSAK